MRIFRGAQNARETLLKRIPFEEMEVSPQTKERLKAVFGEELTPEQAVDRIIADVRARGDEALRDYSRRIDGVEPAHLEVGQKEIEEAYTKIEKGLISALTLAAERIRFFHLQHKRQSWVDFSEGGLGQLIIPLERVGVYAPGGTAAYPSTVLMTAIPAKVAGVSEVILTTPPQAGGVSPLTLVASDIAGVDRVFQVGGAQAIAALAYGTESVPRVDKICGPGNLFVVLAKRRVFGTVGIDGLPGPTETVVVADDSADPALCAADLLAQAEHDVLASAILITNSAKLAEETSGEVEAQLATLERGGIARQSIESRGGIVLVDDLDEAFELANDYAPEHLCLLVEDGWSWVGKVRNAGGIFLGESSSEAMGDYTAGPSHVMPTGGTARFSSPLSIVDFVKITSLVALNERALASLGPATAALAGAEGLTAHVRAIEGRLTRLMEEWER